MLGRREGGQIKGWHGVRIKGADLSDLVEVTLKLGQVDRIALPYLDTNIDLPHYSRLGFIVNKKHAQVSLFNGNYRYPMKLSTEKVDTN